MAAQQANQAVIERAERLRAEHRAAERKSEMLTLVTFRLGRETYALAAHQVRGVITRQTVVPIPSTPPHLLGITNFRGEILPVFDLTVLLGLGTAPTAPDYLLIARPGPDTAALGCDSCPEVVQIAADEIKPPVSASAAPDARYLRGQALVAGGMLRVLDADQVLRY
ncbi:MAG TPA: chemotaxis protein CheW [Armatimonadota bacterium]|nr:chemotaxis protein CheW [Armatimonadota bacterium]